MVEEELRLRGREEEAEEEEEEGGMRYATR